MNRKIPFVPGEYFHIYNRGTDRRVIFQDNNDYENFLKLLFLSNSNKNFKISNLPNDIYLFERGNQLVNIGAYCAMPNHFHLLITPVVKDGVSKFMQKLSTGISMHYNTKYNRTGTLFEGRFKAEHIRGDRHLKYLFSYIHLNPVKLIQPDWKEKKVKNPNEVLRFLKKYYFSSYLEYSKETRKENLIINKSVFPNYFKSSSLINKELLEGITFEVK